MNNKCIKLLSLLFSVVITTNICLVKAMDPEKEKEKIIRYFGSEECDDFVALDSGNIACAFRAFRGDSNFYTIVLLDQRMNKISAADVFRRNEDGTSTKLVPLSNDRVAAYTAYGFFAIYDNKSRDLFLWKNTLNSILPSYFVHDVIELKNRDIAALICDTRGRGIYIKIFDQNSDEMIEEFYQKVEDYKAPFGSFAELENEKIVVGMFL